MENNNVSFVARYLRTTAKGLNVFTVHGTEDDINTYVQSRLKAGLTVSYLKADDQQTELLDKETGLKIPLVFDNLSMMIDEFFDYEFPMVRNQKGIFNPDTTVLAHVEEFIQRFPNSSIEWCISQASKRLQRENARQYQAVSSASTSSVSTPATDTAEGQSDDSDAKASDAINKIVAKKKNSNNS